LCLCALVASLKNSLIINLMKSIINQILQYLYIKKRDPNQQQNMYTKAMHGMNRISIFMFLIALLIMLIKFVILPLLKK
jgi:hypothetical protein